MASFEEGAGGEADYECCTFRGSISALNATTGELLWKSYTVDEPKKVRKNKIGVQLWGPSGVGVWASPTLDPKLKRVYVTTGDNYSDPPSDTSDAIMAFDMETGENLWTQQFTKGDAFNIACESGDDTNCPEARGPDLDFGSSAILRELPGGKRILLAGQKSGVVHAVDPDQDGKILWQQRAGAGGILGGIQWGPAADESNIYVALSDVKVNLNRTDEGSITSSIDNTQGGGISAYRIETGEKLWFTPAARLRQQGQLQPGPVGGHLGPARRGVLRLGGRPPASLLDPRRVDCVGLRHGPGVLLGQRGQHQGRLARRTRPDHCRRYAVRLLRLRLLGRYAGQRPAGL